MKADLSRNTFDSANHFSRVLMQQGRVTLDADSNEQADILLHYLRTLARDLIGPYGGPADALGFTLAVTPATPNPPAPPWTLSIAPGRYYVDGILCENETACSYASQPDCPLPQDDSLRVELGKSSPSMTAFWLYLDIWERHITPVEDDRMREVALGGPDTCTRAKVIWQVKALSQAALTALGINDADCTTPLGALTKFFSGQMAAELDSGKQMKDPCVVAPDARYRGAENQLYRVEIHRGGSILPPGGQASVSKGGKDSKEPTFKWSRDNGSVVTAWLGTDGSDLLIASARGFSAGNWVELSDDTSDLSGDHGIMVKLSSVDGNRLRFDASTPPPAWTSNLKNPKVRRWDQTENDDIELDEGAIPLAGGDKLDWIDLEDGVRVQFGLGNYRTGDYWLIPARVATGEIEWPRSDSGALSVPPRGIEHHYAPLGQLTWSNGAWSVSSCLCDLNPLAKPEPELKRPVAAPASPTLPLPPPSSAPAAASPTLPLPPPSTSSSQPSEPKPQESKPK